MTKINEIVGNGNRFNKKARELAKAINQGTESISLEECRVYLESVLCICGHNELDHNKYGRCYAGGCDCEKLVLQKDR